MLIVPQSNSRTIVKNDFDRLKQLKLSDTVQHVAL